MWISRLKPYVSFAVALLVANVAIALYVPGHFVPEQMLRPWRGKPVGTVLIGNSLLAAGGNEAVLAAALTGRPDAPVANFAVGATNPPEHLLLVRRALAEHRPRRIVYGWYGEQLVAHPLDLSSITGNQVLLFGWSSAGDVTTYFPGWPRRHLLPGLEFLARRSAPLLAYLPLVQGKVEQTRLRALGPAQKENRFGAVEAFRALQGTFETDLLARARALREGKPFELSPSLLRMRAEAHAAGASILWVSMPVPRRDASPEVVAAHRTVLEAAQRALANEGDEVLDGSAIPGLTEAHLSDGLHLNAAGAERFSRWLGEQLQKRAP